MPMVEFESVFPASQLPQTHRRLAHCDRLNILLDIKNSSRKIKKLMLKLNMFVKGIYLAFVVRGIFV